MNDEKRKSEIFGTLAVKSKTFFPNLSLDECINLPTRKFFDSKFPRVYINSLSAFPYTAWCEENFGNNWTWSQTFRGDYVHHVFFFINECDATLFKLRFASE